VSHVLKVVSVVAEVERLWRHLASPEVRDPDGDDRLDALETLRKSNGGGEHGPHAILVAPDGKSLYVVCGDGTQSTEFIDSRVPRVWDEDLLLPRCYVGSRTKWSCPSKNQLGRSIGLLR
jgi:hypothetical protein